MFTHKINNIKNKKVVELPEWTDCKLFLKNNILKIETRLGSSHVVLKNAILSENCLYVKPSSANILKNIILYHHKKYFLILRLKGSNYRFQIENVFNMEVGKSHKTIFKIPNNLNLKRYNDSKDSFIVYGTNPTEVNNFVFKLRKLKPVNPYTGSGLILNKEKIILKQGKKK